VYICIFAALWCISLFVQSTEEVEPSKPKERLHMRKNVCCTDIIFLLLFLAFWGFLVCIRILLLACLLNNFLGISLWAWPNPGPANLAHKTLLQQCPDVLPGDPA